MTVALWIIGAVILGVIVLKLLGRVFDIVDDALRQLLGGLYEYAGIYFVLLSTVVAALAVLFFVVSFPVWIGLFFVVLLLVVVVFELLL